MNMNIDRECLSKIRYESQVKAEVEARTLFNEGFGALNSYACMWCRGAHLTSRPQDAE